MKVDRYASYWYDENGNPCISSRLREKLAKAYRKGLNHREAAIHCGVPHSFLIDLLNYDEAFRMRAEGLQEHTVIQAKLNVADAVEKKQIKSSQWILERKRPEEFSTKADVSVNTGTDSEQKRAKEIEEMLDKL